MATHSSILAWRIPGMGEPGGLPSMGSHRVSHDSCDLAAAAVSVCVYIYTHTHIYHIFFICLSVEGHLSCFLVSVIMNGAAMNRGVHVSF